MEDGIIHLGGNARAVIAGREKRTKAGAKCAGESESRELPEVL